MKESLKTKNPLTTERAIADMFDRLHPVCVAVDHEWVDGWVGCSS